MKFVPRLPVAASAVAALIVGLTLPIAPTRADVVERGATFGPVRCAEVDIDGLTVAADVEIESPAAFVDAARRNDVTVRELGGLAEDRQLLLDSCGRAVYAEPERVPDARASLATAAPLPGVPLEQTFELQSRPGASKTIYLDFGAPTVTGTAWNVERGLEEIRSSRYSHDADRTTLSAADLAEIQRAWQVVAEDFAPFDVNVTTRDPGRAAIVKSTATDDQYGSHVLVVGGNVIADACRCGGLAYLDVFDGLYDLHYQPAWAFVRIGEDGKQIGEVVSHEVGHHYGLSHDGDSRSPYHAGTAPWAPIMGVGYYHPVTQWSRGEYPDASNTEDDLALISRYAAVLADDHADLPVDASYVVPGVPRAGLISTRADVDAFTFTGFDTTTTTITVTGAPAGNLDVRLQVLDENGHVVARVDPPVAAVSHDRAEGLGAVWTGDVPVGATWTALVEGVGSSEPGTAGAYGDYGSLGHYVITVGDPVVPPPTPVPAPYLDPMPRHRAMVGRALEGWVTGGDGTPPYRFAAAGLPPGVKLSAGGRLSGRPVSPGRFTARITLTDATGRSTTAGLTIVVAKALVLAPGRSTLPRAKVRRSYEVTLRGAGGTRAYRWTVARRLPPGVRLAPRDGRALLVGKPTRRGDYRFTVVVRDAHGFKKRQAYRIVVR